KEALAVLDLAPEKAKEVFKTVKMSRTEAQSLAVLSNSSQELRSKMIRWQMDADLRAQFRPRVLSIAGIFPCNTDPNSSQSSCQSSDAYIETLKVNNGGSGLFSWFGSSSNQAFIKLLSENQVFNKDHA